MTDSAAFEPAEDLVLRAQEAGFAVTTEQIARWNRDGLLPKPYQHGLGRGQGSQIFYPIETGKQLVALCQLHRQYRKLEIVGWYLWLNGFSVDRRYWKKPLIVAAELFVGMQKLFKKKLLDTVYGIVSTRRSGEKMLEALSVVQTSNRHFRRARRRVGVGQIGEFCRIMATMAVGAYRADAEFNAEDKAAERTVIERGLGTVRGRIDRLDNGLTLLTRDIEPDLEEFSRSLAKITKSSMLGVIDTSAIQRARDQLRLLLYGMRMTYVNHEKTHGKNAFGLGVIADFATITDIKLQALMILLFEITIRSDPNNRLREILAAIEAKRATDGWQRELSERDCSAKPIRDT